MRANPGATQAKAYPRPLAGGNGGLLFWSEFAAAKVL
jgi:hypothetical protein